MNVPRMTNRFPRKVAILFGSEAIGGAERYLVELAIGMRRIAADPVVINLKRFVPYRDYLDRDGIPVHSGIAHRRFDPSGAWRLFRLLRKLSPDALLVNSNRQAMWLVPPVSRLAGVPVTVIHTHNHLGEYRASFRFSARVSDGVVGAASAHATRLVNEGLPADRVYFVYPGVDRSRTGAGRAASANESRRPNPVVGIIAALRPEKDHETFIRAAAIAHGHRPEARFHIVGDGGRRPMLERLARESGVEEAVVFRGWQAVDEALLRSLDLLALSSVSETFPAVILEAFSAGVPVVSTNVGAIEELAGDPPAALLVPPGDHEALARAMLKVLAEPRLGRELAERGHDRVAYFDADRFGEDMLSLLRNVQDAKTRVKQ